MLFGVLPCFACFALFVLFCFAISRNQSKAFEAKFPPISDDEFLARSGPGTNRDVALKVRRIVADQLGVEYERIYPETRFLDDLGAD